MTPPEIAEVAARLRRANRVAVLTGAGVSAASGVPTFRSADGLWRRFRPIDLATPEAFARDRHTVWEWYQWRRALIARCQPNAAHDVLARWSHRPGWQVVTQNVDDLHLRAGTRGLVRLHGSIWELSCWRRCPARGSTPWRDDRAQIPAEELVCPSCRGPARPAVVWFGEPLDPGDLRRAEAAMRCDIFITAGTSAMVYPAAGLIDVARQAGAFTVEINPELTEASACVACQLQAPAEDALARIDALI